MKKSLSNYLSVIVLPQVLRNVCFKLFEGFNYQIKTLLLGRLI